MLMLLTGRLPALADVITWEGWRLEIVDLDGRTIDKVLATRITPDADTVSLLPAPPDQDPAADQERYPPPGA
jgi:hypothetical protein